MIEILADKRGFTVPRWPVCQRCLQRWRGCRIAMWIAPFVGPAVMFWPFPVIGFFGVESGPVTDQKLWFFTFLIGFAVWYSTILLFVASRPTRVAKLASNREATVLRIRRPSPRFVADFEACVRGEAGGTGAFSSPVVDRLGDPQPPGAS